MTSTAATHARCRNGTNRRGSVLGTDAGPIHNLTSISARRRARRLPTTKLESQMPRRACIFSVGVALLVTAATARGACFQEPQAGLDISETARQAIVKLNAVGVDVVLRPFEDDECEHENAPAQPVSIRFTADFRSDERHGFEADSSVKALAELLRSLPNVVEIDLGGTNVRDDHLALLAGMGTLRKLRLAVAWDITDEGLANLKGLTALTALSLGWDRQVSDAGVAHLAGLTSMVDLDLEATGITDAGMSYLRGMEKLERLTLGGSVGGCKVTGAGLKNVSKMKHLRWLNLAWTRVDDLDGLQGLAALRDLDLHGTPIGDAALANLAELTDMVSLRLSDTQITDAGIAFLSGMTKLETLYVDRTRISGAGLKHLERMRRLEALSLNGTKVTDAGLAHLRGLPLDWLSLDDSGVTDAGMVHLTQLKRLRYLSAEDTKVTRKGVEPLRSSTALGGETGQVSVGPSDPVAKNPSAVDRVDATKIARVKELLSWLPEGTETVGVAHGPFAFSSPFNDDRDSASTVTLFEDWVFRIVAEPLPDCSALQHAPGRARGPRQQSRRRVLHRRL